MPNCSVPFCTRIGGHRFPRDKELRKKWIIAVKRLQPDGKRLWTPGPASRICSDHFLPSDYAETLLGKNKSLRTGAVPSVFAFRKKVINSGRDERALRRSSNGHFTYTGAGESPASDLNTQDEEIVTEPSSTEHILDQPDVVEESRSRSVGVQCESSSNSGSFFMELMTDPTAMKYYTGFNNYKHFDLFFRALGQAAFHLKYKCYSLHPREQLLLTLTKLRQAKDDYELSRYYRVSETTVRQVFTTWINFMYYQLKELDIWPDEQTVMEYMPEDFKRKFPKTRVILDATEFPIQKPSNLIAQSATFSSYKNRNTLKTVVGCTPAGLVSFVSDTYGGRASNRQIMSSK